MPEVTVDGWIASKDRLPSATTLVLTKIDDENGVRNVQSLCFHNNLWWTGEGADAMYVYYSPTHWRPLEPNPAHLKQLEQNRNGSWKSRS